MNKLKIGGHQVELIIKNVNGKEYIGITDFNIPSITIDSETCQSLKESSLIHEAIHMMNTTIDGENMGHAFIDGLSEQIYQFLSDNGLLNKQRLGELLTNKEESGIIM